MGVEESTRPDGTGDAYHYVSYVPYEGAVYELDGLKESPIWHGTFQGDGWLELVKPVLRERMQNSYVPPPIIMSHHARIYPCMQ